jgi:hypothetical protein
VDEGADDLVIVPESMPPASLKKVAGVRPRGPVDIDRLLREQRRDR